MTSLESHTETDSKDSAGITRGFKSTHSHSGKWDLCLGPSVTNRQGAHVLSQDRPLTKSSTQCLLVGQSAAGPGSGTSNSTAEVASCRMVQSESHEAFKTSPMDRSTRDMEISYITAGNSLVNPECEMRSTRNYPRHVKVNKYNE